MKKLSKKIISIVLALIMAMPMVFALPSTASANASDGTPKIVEWDLTTSGSSVITMNSNGSGENRGTASSSYGSATLNLICWGNGDKLWQKDGSNGAKSDDGIAWIQDTSSLLTDGKDIEISFTMATRDSIGDSSHGVFAIGSAYADAEGDSAVNDFIALDNNGSMKYNHSTEIAISQAAAKPVAGTFYTYRIYFDYTQKRVNIFRDNVLIGTYQNNSISKSNFKCIVFGTNITKKWTKNTIKKITISQYTNEQYVKNNISSFAFDDITSPDCGNLQFTSGGVSYTDKVLYPNSASAQDSSNYSIAPSGNNNTAMQVKITIPSSRIVYLYDGSNNGSTSHIKIPLILQVYKSGSTVIKWGANYAASTNSNVWELGTDWFKCGGWDNWTQSVSGNVNDGTIISKDSSHNHEDITSGNRDKSNMYNTGEVYLSDYVTYKSTINENNYSSTLTNPTFNISIDWWAQWDLGFTKKYYNGNVFSNVVPAYGTTLYVKVVNVKPLTTALGGSAANFKSAVNNVIDNDWMYTSASLANYYDQVARIMKFHINNYNYSTDAGITSVTSEMSGIITDYDSAVNGLDKKTFKITYSMANGNSIEEEVTAGEYLAEIPEHTASYYINNNTHRTNIGWASAPSDSHMPHGDETYTETYTDEACNFADVVHAASAANNGYTDQKCSVCNHVDESQRVYNPLDWDTYDDNLGDYTDAIESDLYTDDSKTACTTAVTAAISGINRGTMTGANTPQSTVNTAATAISDALANLKGRAAFGALDAAKTAAMNWANDSARAAEYTSSSIQAYKDYLDSTTVFPFENSASRTNTPATDENNAAISAEKTAYENAQTYAIANILDPLADLTTLESAYEEGDAILKSLVGKTAQYDAASVQALIDAVEDANDSEYIGATAEEKADFGTVGENSDQDKADDLADDINNAINGLTLAAVDSTTGKAVDTSVFDSLVNTLNNLDPDAYEENEGGSLASAKSTINSLYGTATKEYEGETINVVNGITSQDAADAAADKIQTALTVCTKKYTITRSGVTDFGINNGTEEGGKVNYGATLTCRSGDDETAWFIEVQTGSMHKKYTFQSYGKTLKTKVLGTTTVNAIKRDSTNNCRIMITRSYGDDREPIQYASFVPSGTEFTLPAAPSIAYTTFDGYSYKNGSVINTATITVTEDVDIVANYTESDASCAINATDINSVAHNSTVKYNEKVELDGGAGTYGWIEQVGTTYRPFYKGQKVSFLATESTTLLAVNQATFDSYGKAPIINLRKGGVIVSDSKYIFNAQLVPGNADVREYGILIAAPSDKNGATPIAPANSQIIVENSGQHEGYAILRAKSTKLVGANQFSIAVNNLPSGYKYRGYVIYHDGSSLQTVYTDIH
jgi:hypothetical protein